MLAIALAPHGVGGERLLTDKGLHFLAFAGLALFGAASAAMAPGWRAIGFWAAMAIGIEIAQGVMSIGREPSGVDACASFAGAVFALALARRMSLDTLRGTIVAGCAALAATAAVDLGYRVLRGPVTAALLARAYAHADPTPWPGAPARAYAALSLDDARAPIMIVDRATPRALALAPGVWPGKYPGDRGVTILMGHRNAAFRALGALDVGRSIRLVMRDGARFEYVVSRREIVPWNDSRLYPDAPGEQLALVTCWPVDSDETSPWRLVVYAARAPDRD
jgi:sortase A